MRKITLSIAIAYSLLITWLSLGRLILPSEVRIKHSDKLGHLIAYFGFAMVWCLYSFYKSRINESNFNKKAIRVVIISMGYGILMEICQALLTDYRSFDILDMLANTFGAILAYVILNFWKEKIIKFIHKQIS